VLIINWGTACLEEVELEEGKEVIVTIKEIPKETKDAFERAAGSWKGLVDTERLIKDIYESRRIRAPRLNYEISP